MLTRADQNRAPGDEDLPDLTLAMPLRRSYTYPSTHDIDVWRSSTRSRHTRRQHQDHDSRRDDLRLGRISETTSPQTFPLSREIRCSINKSVFATDRLRVHSGPLSSHRLAHELAEPHASYSMTRDNHERRRDAGAVMTTSQTRFSRVGAASNDRDSPLREDNRTPTLQRWYSQLPRQEPYNMIADLSPILSDHHGKASSVTSARSCID